MSTCLQASRAGRFAPLGEPRPENGTDLSERAPLKQETEAAMRSGHVSTAALAEEVGHVALQAEPKQVEPLQAYVEETSLMFSDSTPGASITR